MDIPSGPSMCSFPDTFREGPLRATAAGIWSNCCCALYARHELPEAFIVSSDLLAVGVMKAIQEAGYRIPEDLRSSASTISEISCLRSAAAHHSLSGPSGSATRSGSRPKHGMGADTAE